MTRLSYRTLQPRAELQQPFTKCGDLRTSARSPTGAKPKFLHQHIGGGGEHHPQLVGPETRAAGAVNRQPVEQLLDAVLDVGVLAIDRFVHPLR